MYIRGEFKKLQHPPRHYTIQYARNNVVYLTARLGEYQEATAIIREKSEGMATVYWTIPERAPLIHNGKKRRRS